MVWVRWQVRRAWLTAQKLQRALQVDAKIGLADVWLGHVPFPLDD
jgi:hypothetical protein